MPGTGSAARSKRAVDERAGQDHRSTAPDDEREHDGQERHRAGRPRRRALTASAAGLGAWPSEVRALCGHRWPSAGRPRPSVAVRPSTTATSLPRYMTAIRSDSSSTSSSSAETSRTAVPASRLAITWRWMNSMLPDVQARGSAGRGRAADSVPVELAGHDHLLLVAAGQGAGRDGRRTGVRMSNCSMASAARARMAVVVADAVARIGLRVVVA